jgi:hypothetical protein
MGQRKVKKHRLSGKGIQTKENTNRRKSRNNQVCFRL